MRKKRVRMIDVADAAGVSRTTASFVLNGRADEIAVETRDRVLRIAHQMNYTPNAAAINLATGKTHRIGVVLYNTHFFSHLNTYHLQLLTHITAAVTRHNQNLLLHTATYPRWRELASEILGGVSDGVLLVGRPANDELTSALLEQNFPTVCLSYVPDDPRCYAVDCDNAGGSYAAMTHLIRLGHQRVLFGMIGANYSWEQERLNGARKAFVDAGISPENLTCADLDHDLSAFIERHLCHSSSRITAVYVSGEDVAQRLIELLPQFGLSVPHDIAVICFDSSEFSERTRPPATGVAQPLGEIGNAAVDMLMKLIEREEVSPRILRFSTRLDIRESCGESLSNAR
jgi:LacI family transcriptional regulator